MSGRTGSKLLLGCTALVLAACTQVTTPADRVDLRALAAGGAVYEVEALGVAEVSGAATANSSDGLCSGDHCAFLAARGRGPYVTYRAAVPAAGRYTVSVRVKRWNARGVFQLATSEGGSFTDLGAPANLYSAAASFATLTLGEVAFGGGGDKLFRFAVTGKDPRSGGYALALDTLTLTPAGGSAGPGTAPTGGGWVPLFNGRDLAGWSTFLSSRGRNNDPQGVIKVEDGTIHILDVPDRGQRQDFGYLATTRRYGDYHLRFQYRWGSKRFAPRDNAVRDSGVIYHIGGGDRVWPAGAELQVQEGDTGDFWMLGGTVLTTTVASASANPVRYREGGTPYTTRPGSYVRVAKNATRDARSGWNTVELIVRGDEAVHIVNGAVVNRAVRLRDAGGDPLTAGRIAFQVEGAEVYYRDIEIKPLVGETGGGTATGGRTVLFNGSSTAAWEPARGGARWPVKNGAMEVPPGSRVGANDFQTKGDFGDFKLHLEFMVPPSPRSAGEQGRGNSGVYLQGRYEVQILDSYGRTLSGQNDAGAVYGVRDAARNASRPAGSWQSYDITFRAARYSGGRKVSPAYVTVYWNGVRVHAGTAVPRSTTLGAPEGPSRGPIRLQDHGRPVRYRNIWIEPLN